MLTVRYRRRCLLRFTALWRLPQTYASSRRWPCPSLQWIPPRRQRPPPSHKLTTPPPIRDSHPLNRPGMRTYILVLARCKFCLVSCPKVAPLAPLFRIKAWSSGEAEFILLGWLSLAPSLRVDNYFFEMPFTFMAREPKGLWFLTSSISIFSG